MLEPHRQRLIVHLDELVGVVVAHHRQMLGGGAQILADGQDVAVDCPQIEERMPQLRPSLAQADHDRRLGMYRRRRVQLSGVRLRSKQYAERSVVSSPLPDRLLQPRHRLDVVIQDVRPGRHHRSERRFLAVEIGDQHLHAHARAGDSQPADRLGEDARPAVVQVVASHARDDDVVQVQLLQRLRDPARLIEVVDERLAGLHGAEPAGTGTRVAEDHHGRGPLVPTLAHIRAVRFLADGVERQPVKEPPNILIGFSRRHPSLDPLGVPARRLGTRRRPVDDRIERSAAHGDGRWEQAGGAVVVGGVGHSV